jgi:hypothetical protein
VLNEMVVEDEKVSNLPLDENARVVDDLDELLQVARRDGSTVSVGGKVVIGVVGAEVRGFEGVVLMQRRT